MGTNVFLLIIIGSLCSTYPYSYANPLQGCECNIMGACDAEGKPRSKWAQYLPSGVNGFGYVVQGAQNLAYLCEDGTVVTLFDGNAQIPLYSAIVMTGKQLTASDGGGRPTKHFRQSTKVDRKYQQKAVDYDKANQRNVCFKKKTTKTRVVDKKWASAAKKAAVKKGAGKTGSVNVCLPVNLKAPIHKGHLVASQYGRGDKKRMMATFTYTNVVPQFGLFNSGPWQQCESSLITWGKNNCATGKKNAKLYIVVGAIPSTISKDPEQIKFFGKEGFSNFQDENNYPVNVPELLWTAACCTYEYTDNKGKLQTGVQSTAFQGENIPGGSKCDKRNVQALTAFLSAKIPGNINLFPHSPQCYNNYIPL